ncbi:hypothetical protein [Clostridium massiliodielmoense]|uniref:hypothetical protein n=1 Tax=Clostridium massiliodielmoense TaxID=1776385 RepID=UPI000A26D59D|nr:hypothetical protein [Clostridium massiliodielmoense]
MRKKFLFLINCVILLLLPIIVHANTTTAYGTDISILSNLNSNYSKFKSMDVPKNKIFTIDFNKEINSNTITKDTLIVIDKNGKIMNTRSHLCTDKKSIALLPPIEGYIVGEQYAILIKKGIKALDSSVIKKQVVMIFNVKSKEELEKAKIQKEKIENSKPIQKDSIETIVKALEGKRSGNLKKGFYESEDPNYWFRFNISSKSDEFMKKMYNIWHYNDYVNSMKILDTKYKNKYYQEITDYNYYKKLPNLTINFNNCNNIDEFRSSSLFLAFDSKVNEGFPSFYAPSFYPSYSKATSRYESQFDLITDKTHKFSLCQFIWRPDLEKQMVEEINKKRGIKGLKPLKLSNDLIAIGKYSAKRSYLSFSYSNLGYKLPGSISCNFKCWANGTIPYAFENTNNKNVDLDIQKAICLEDHSKELFSYNKPVKCISESSCIYKNARDFIYNWEQQQLYIEVKINKYEYNPKLKSTFYNYPNSVPKEKYHAPIKLENNIYNPNVTEIGVGCIYAPPINEGDINGCIGYFIVVS